MGRVVQVPYVYRDEQRDRSFYLRRFPKEVTPLTGQWFQHKYPSSWSHKQAERESHKQAAEFNAMVETLWSHLKEESLDSLKREKTGPATVLLPKE